MSGIEVDPPRFRRLTFEGEWLSQLQSAADDDPLAVLLVAEANAWLQFGLSTSYFDAEVTIRDDPEAHSPAAGEVLGWLRKLPIPADLDAVTVAQGLANAREDLTPERSALLRNLLFSSADDWDSSLAALAEVTSLLADESRELLPLLAEVAWAVEVISNPEDDHEDPSQSMLPAAWRAGALADLAAIAPSVASRVQQLWTAARAADQAIAAREGFAYSRHVRWDAAEPPRAALDDIAALEGMSDWDFTDAIAALLARKGYTDVERTSGPDFGADLLATLGTARTVVQVMRTVAPTDVAAVRRILTARSLWEAEQALIVTSSFFTAAAAALARDRDVALVDRRVLRDWFSGEQSSGLIDVVTPRTYQIAALLTLRRARARGERRALIEMAPGLGKTYVAALDARQMQTEVDSPLRVLYISHQAIILQQARRTFQAAFGTNRSYGQFDSTGHELDRDLVFATFQSLHGSIHEVEPGAFDYVIVDEAHHTLAPTRDAVVDHLTPSFLLGLTATPIRGDGQDVAPYYGDVVAASIPLERAMASGLLAPVDYRMVSDELDSEAFRAAIASGVDLRELNGHLFRPISDEAIVNTVMSEASTIDGKRRILVFCESIAQMNYFSGLFPSSRSISGFDTRERQLQTVDGLRAGEFEVLLSRDVLNEGIDIPHVSTLVFLRNTESHVVFLQQLGRGLRKIEGKVRVDVFDFVNTIPRIERVYQFFSRLESAQSGARERSDPVLEGATSRMSVDDAARDVIDALLARRRASGTVADLGSIGEVINPDISSATLRRMVDNGRLVPDFVVPGSTSTGAMLFENRSLERLMRQVRAPQYTAGLLKDREFARAIGQRLSDVRHAQRRGQMPAAWVHLQQNGRLELYYEPTDVAELIP